MKALAALLIGMAAVLPAAARVGEKLPLLEERYGTPFCTGNDEFDATNKVYEFDQPGVTALRKRGYQIFAVVDAAMRCQEIAYVKSNGGPINNSDIQGMLLANSAGLSWKTVRSSTGDIMFVRGDGVIAFLPMPSRLEVMSVERASLRGFNPEDS